MLFRVSETLTGECKEKHRRGEAGLVKSDVNVPLSILSDPNINNTEVIDIQTTLLMGGIDTVSACVHQQKAYIFYVRSDL